MSRRIDKAKLALLALLACLRLPASASPFDGLPTPRVPGFGWIIPVPDGLTGLQLSLNAALGDGLFAFAGGFDLKLFLSTLAVAVAYGAVHALSPGHGKTLLLVQGLGVERLELRAFLAPCLGALLHVFSALLWTTIFTLIAAASILILSPGTGSPGRAELSIALLAFSSCILVLNGLLNLIPGRVYGRSHGRRRGWLAVALGIGLIPCPISTIVFSAALANGLAVYGLIICLIFGLGLAFTMTLFALLPFFFRSAFTRILASTPGRLALKVLPILSSALFVALGVMGIIQAISIA